MRICTICRQEKTEIEFVRLATTRKTGLCRDCKKRADREYGKRNRKRISAYARTLWENDPARKTNNRLSKELKRFGLNAKEYIKGKDCEICGKSNEDYIAETGRRLDINHIDDNGRKALRLRQSVNNSLDNFMVVCRSCHVSWHNKNVRIY